MSWPRPPPAPNYSSYRSEAFVEKFTHEPSDVGWHLRLLNAVHVNAFTPECNLESPPPPGPRTRSWYRRLSPLLYCISVAGRPCPSHSLQRATLRKGSTLSAPTRSHMSRTHSRIYESQGKYRTVAKVGGWVGGWFLPRPSPTWTPWLLFKVLHASCQWRPATHDTRTSSQRRDVRRRHYRLRERG